MKKVELLISSLVDIEPYVIRNNKVVLTVWMNEIQIKLNRIMLVDLETENKAVSKIRMVK